MWIGLVFVIALGRAHPLSTLDTSEGIPDVSASSTTEASYLPIETPYVETVTTLENITDDSSYLVAILDQNNFLLGAGAIVGENWVLVTAFQMGAFKPHQLKVRVGSRYPLSGGQLLSVERIFPHPMFKEFNNDVALMKTADTIAPGGAASWIPVAGAPPDMGDGATLWLWEDNNPQKNRADILPISECRAFYPDFELTDSNICAVLDHILPFQVSLYGSPLVYNESLVGLYMGMEANMFKPSLCSNLSPLVGWIHAMMKNETATQLLFPLNN